MDVTIRAMINPWWTDAVPLWKQQTFPRLSLAILLGTAIGAERQWRRRAAGLRTNTLVCLGAAAFVDLGLTIAPNTTQVVAYVVSGVGFLGAGAIMKEGANVRGLNTAATLWCSAAVGACAGAGELLDSIFVAFLLLSINSVMRPLSRFIDQRSLARLDPEFYYSLRIFCERDHLEEAVSHLRSLVTKSPFSMEEVRQEASPDSEAAMIQTVLQAHALDDKALRDLKTKLSSCPWVTAVEIIQAPSEAE